ncbi:MAG: outer membrane beta-barrel protein [Candidatus Zixiibacteriota bacterium]
MKKAMMALGLFLILASGAFSQDIKLGIGVFGGLNIPIVQQDQAMGSAFGVRARLAIKPIFVIEPNLILGKWGKPGKVDGYDLGIDGSKVTSYGIDLVLGGAPGVTGFKPLFFAGAGIYSIKNDDTGYDESKLGFDGGLGFMIGAAPSLDLDIRGILMIAPQEEGSKKATIITGGLTYYLGAVK